MSNYDGYDELSEKAEKGELTPVGRAIFGEEAAASGRALLMKATGAETIEEAIKIALMDKDIKEKELAASEKEKETFIRLSVNMNTETAKAMKAVAEAKGLSVTEAVRRMVAVYAFLYEESNNGSRIILEKGNRRTEIVLR